MGCKTEEAATKYSSNKQAWKGFSKRLGVRKGYGDDCNMLNDEDPLAFYFMAMIP